MNVSKEHIPHIYLFTVTANRVKSNLHSNMGSYFANAVLAVLEAQATPVIKADVIKAIHDSDDVCQNVYNERHKVFINMLRIPNTFTGESHDKCLIGFPSGTLEVKPEDLQIYISQLTGLHIDFMLRQRVLDDKTLLASVCPLAISAQQWFDHEFKTNALIKDAQEIQNTDVIYPLCFVTSKYRNGPAFNGVVLSQDNDWYTILRYSPTSISTYTQKEVVSVYKASVIQRT